MIVAGGEPGKERDSIEIVSGVGVVGLCANHGPMEITLSFSPEQAEQLAAAMLAGARNARVKASEEADEKLKGVRPS